MVKNYDQQIPDEIQQSLNLPRSPIRYLCQYDLIRCSLKPIQPAALPFVGYEAGSSMGNSKPMVDGNLTSHTVSINVHRESMKAKGPPLRYPHVT
jgi:hypothetical protein